MYFCRIYSFNPQTTLYCIYLHFYIPLIWLCQVHMAVNDLGSHSVLYSDLCRGGTGPPTCCIGTHPRNVPYLKHPLHDLSLHYHYKTIGSSSYNLVRTLIFFTATNLRKLIQTTLGYVPSILLVSNIHPFDPPTAQMHPSFATWSLKGEWFVSISSAVTTGLNPSLGITWSSCTGCQMPSKVTEIDGDNFPHPSFVVYTVTLFNFNLSGD